MNLIIINFTEMLKNNTENLFHDYKIFITKIDLIRTMQI